jgi:hypothetical protein
MEVFQMENVTKTGTTPEITTVNAPVLSIEEWGDAYHEGFDAGMRTKEEMMLRQMKEPLSSEDWAWLDAYYEGYDAGIGAKIRQMTKPKTAATS